jgi:Tfp pilus assembly protein PilO
MKIDLGKIKDLAGGVNLFWQMIVGSLLGALVIFLIASLVFWFNLEKELDSLTVNQKETKAGFDHKDIDEILVKIEDRAKDLTNTMTNLPILVDPSL